MSVPASSQPPDRTDSHGHCPRNTLTSTNLTAVISLDFADGFNTYTITSLYGNNRRRAPTLLASDALAPVTGAASTLAFTIRHHVLGCISGSSPGSCSTWPPLTSATKCTPAIPPASRLPAPSSARASCGW
jgi:hypothetical protein